ncbi:MAG: hypothetical protein IPM04_12520 [Saprospiraceae bacterium]|nr:hypothetical protein [Candidatus Brachybacter algidus]MBK8748649.1 hypothetical protein [Candidatus Brachybacter algidus]
MTIEERRRRRFSEEFRKEIVFKIESGAISVKEVSVLYFVKAENVRTGYGSMVKSLFLCRFLFKTAEINRVLELEKEAKKLKPSLVNSDRDPSS